MKLVLDKEEEMVCMREAAERRVKKLLKRNAELASKIKAEKSKSEVSKEKEAKGSESTDSGKEQSLKPTKILVRQILNLKIHTRTLKKLWNPKTKHLHLYPREPAIHQMHANLHFLYLNSAQLLVQLGRI